ncbi:MAG TPA: histidine kinase [Micromonospora sp.]
MVTAVVPEAPWLLPSALTAPPDGSRDVVRRSTRDWIVDGLCFLLSVGWVVTTTWDAAQTTPVFAGRPAPWLVPVDAAVALGVCAALWTRRRWPTGLAVATLPLALFSAASAVALVIIYFTVVVHRRMAVAATLTVAVLVTTCGYGLLRPDPGLSYGQATALGVVITGAVLAWGLFVRARRQLVLSLRDRAHRAEAEQQLRVAQARQLERTRIAREMHDVLAHRISLLSLHAGALEFRPDAPPAEVARAAGVIRESAHAALRDLREVIGVLRADDSGADPAAGDVPERPQPTLVDVPELVEQSRAAGVRVTLRDLVTGAESVPEAVGRSAYRIVQEGLTNARKHATGTAVTVELAGGPGRGLTVEIRNRKPVGTADGPAVPGTGTGLVGIAERVSLAGGRLEYGRDDAGDFRLTTWLPWPA